MDYTDIASYVNYIRLAVLAVVALLAVIGAVRRSKLGSDKRDMLHGIAATVVVIVMAALSPVASWFYVVVFLVIGLVLGFLLGRIRPLTAWIVAFAQIYFTMAILWDAGGYFAAGLGVLSMAAGIPLAQAIRGKLVPKPSHEQIAAKPSMDGSTEGTWDFPQA